MRALKESQLGCLEGLVGFGEWHHRSGWKWSSEGRTERIMRSLERLGLAETKTFVWGGAKIVGYIATAKGKTVLENSKRW